MYKLIDLIRASWFDFMKIYNKNYIETNDIFFTDFYQPDDIEVETEKHYSVVPLTQVKLGEIFECEGVLYSIATSTLTGDSNLEDGRNIFKFIKD
jgi:hypothetical protein